MTAQRINHLLLVAFMIAGSHRPSLGAEDSGTFTVGAAGVDITPPPGLPLWGYAARHDSMATGTLDPLLARAVVLEANGRKLAIVATDLGRGPTPSMMASIRAESRERAGITDVLVSGSHTHHGPVLELIDRPGRGGGQAKFAPAIAYARSLPDRLVGVIVAADRARKPARIGVHTRDVERNRNRQSRHDPKPIDHSLVVVRIEEDDLEARPIALLVNYAAHPTLVPSKSMLYSADYPGAVRSRIEFERGAPCLFFQGAAGDLAALPEDGARDHRAFGESLALEALDANRSIRATRPAAPELNFITERFRFGTRIDLKNPLVVAAYGRAFFPELVNSMADEFGGGADPELSVALIGRDLAIVAGSGEFFCEHANRFRSRTPGLTTLFLGYCNGHHMYFPTIEAAAEGGYGTEPGTSLAQLGAGERMMDRALILRHRLAGRFEAERLSPP